MRKKSTIYDKHEIPLLYFRAQFHQFGETFEYRGKKYLNSIRLDRTVKGKSFEFLVPGEVI